MAKKTIKAAPVLRAASETDFTYRNPLHAVIRFNSACVLAVDVDTEQNTVSIVMENDINNTKKTGTCILSEEV